MKKTFSNKEILQHYSVLNHYIDLYFLKHKLAIEIDEKDHMDRKKEKEEEREKKTKQKLDCKFIRINPDEENFVEYNVTL